MKAAESIKEPYTLPFLITKILAIGYVTVIYFFLGMGLAKLFDIFYGRFDKSSFNPSVNVSGLWLTLDIILHIFLLAIVIYAIRNVVERIPFPLDGIAGYKHSRLKELQGGIIFSSIAIIFSKNLTDKVKYFMKTYLLKEPLILK